MKLFSAFIALSILCINCSSPMNPIQDKSIINPLPECPESPNCFRASYAFNDDIDEVFTAAKNALEDKGAHQIDIVKDTTVTKIDAVFKIPVFGWLDDVAIEMENNNESSVLHIRSSSREGYWDIGVNKRRVKKIIKGIQKELNSN